MRLAAGLRPDQLGGLERSPNRPSSRYKGEGTRGGSGRGERDGDGNVLPYDEVQRDSNICL